MTANLLDGRALAAKIKKALAEEARKRKIAPGLVFLTIEGDAASARYATGVKKACEETGFFFHLETFPKDISLKDFLSRLESYNAKMEIDGILVQSPLPASLDFDRVRGTIAAAKDVDGVNPLNQGLLFSGRDSFVPCTAKGIVRLLEENGIALEGKHVVVVGRSKVVGRPLAMLLLDRNATVTICHSKTRNLPRITKQGEILVVSVGSPELIGKEHVAEGAVVVDVGIHELNGQLVGDVNFSGVREVASWITPVPGGVGPMTVAALMENVLQACFMKERGRSADS